MAETPTSIARNASFVGWLSGDDLLVEGRLEGNLTATRRAHLGPTSSVRASVDADVTQIDGEFEGEVRTRVLRIGPSGRASGRFRFESLLVADGAVVEGAFNEEPAAAPAEVSLPDTELTASGAELTVAPADDLADHPRGAQPDLAPPAEQEQPTAA